MVMANLALGSYQQRLAEEIGIEPGAEMKAAVNVARNKHLPVILIDRDIGITFKRIYSNVPFWRRFAIFGGLVSSLVSREKVSEQDIERLKEGDMLETAFSNISPAERDIFTPLIGERDQFMVARLQCDLKESGYKHVLAVVGAGHLRGMHEILQNPPDNPEETVKQLNYIPPASAWLKVIPWAIVLLIFLGFAIGFSRNSDLGWELIADWILINGGLAALGALIANAHPMTVVGAFIAAPITSLNPTIGAGMVTAFIETYYRKPNVGDFASLRKDTAHIKGWWQNRVSRVLLVFFFCTLGSAMGTYIAGFRIFDKLT
jgi:pheromone shutdown-related protein TraB